MSAQTAADLRAAADVLERDGWLQGDYGTRHGPKCLAGAVNHVVNGGGSVDDLGGACELEDRAADAVQSVAALLGQGYADITRWNDAPGRTAAEVIAALRAAADRVETTP